MRRDDRRVRRTRAALAQALITLTIEQGYDAVTIRSLTKHAGVSYATYFRHYADKDALLRDVLDVVLGELLALLGVQGQARGVVTSPAEDGAVIFCYVQEHAALIRVLLETSNSHIFMRRLREQGVQSTLAANQPHPAATVPPELAADHLVMSTIAMIRWWLEHDMPYPPERMGQICADLIIQPAIALAFLPTAREAPQTEAQASPRTVPQ